MPKNICFLPRFNEFVLGSFKQFQIWGRRFNNKKWSLTFPSRCIAQSLELIKINTMVHSTCSAITSGNEERGRGRQKGNGSGSGSSSARPPGRSGRRTYAQIIQEAIEAYNVGTPAQVK